MNREIKFRALNGEQMVSPDYIDRHGIAFWKENSIPQMSDKVMQFTGLTDKNGKEIYELHEIDNKYRVVYLFNRYVLQSISNKDIFVEIIKNEQYEITGEYCPMEKD